MSVFRTLSIAFVLVLLFAFTGKASAQVSVYGTAMSSLFGFRGDNYPAGTTYKPRTTGFTSGVFYTFPGVSRFKSGFDARATFSPGYDGGKAYTAAIRMSFVPNRFLLRPYAQFGGGAASTQLHESLCNGFGCSQKTEQITGGVVQFDVGLDIRITSRFDIRAFDYGVDKGGSRGLTSAAVGFVSAGAVYHFGYTTIGRP